MKNAECKMQNQKNLIIKAFYEATKKIFPLTFKNFVLS